MSKHTILPRGKSNATCDDGWIDSQLSREMDSGFRRAKTAGRAGPPCFLRHQHLAGKRIGFLFENVRRLIGVQIIKESGAIRQMPREMNELMHQTKPEIVETIMSRGQSNNRYPATIQNCSTIQMSPSQMRLDHEHDPVLLQEFLREARTAIEYAHMRDLLKKIIR